MSKRILILAGSPRKNGNSAALCRDFARGAEESGHQVETIFLRDQENRLLPGLLPLQKKRRHLYHQG